MNRVDTMMHRLLTDAGIVPGMRVLDAGSGHGNLSALIAPMVLPGGAVLGIDHEAAHLDVARAKMSELGYKHAVFQQADLSRPLPDLGQFDAVVVRRVLMYLPDPAATLSNLAGLLRPCGLLIVQEMQAPPRAERKEALPLHERVRDWVWRTIAAEGADLAIGPKLGAMLNGAGMAVQDVRAELNVQTPYQDYPAESIIRYMADRIVAQGIATRPEVEAETADLDERLAAERRAGWKTWAGELVWSAWGTRAA